MATAYWFCPENDIALGRDTASFTPPRQAAMLGRYGAPLPWWSGTPDDVVLVPSDFVGTGALCARTMADGRDAGFRRGTAICHQPQRHRPYNTATALGYKPLLGSQA